MSEENTITDGTEQNGTGQGAPEQEIAEQQLPAKKVYRYQPHDDEGRSLGGEQVVEYRDEQELADKMSKMHVEAIKLARKLKKEAMLGQLQVEEERLPDDVELSLETSELRPRELSAEERWQLTRDLADPEKFDDAANRLLEAKLGAKPEQLRNTLEQARRDIAALRVQQEAKMFCESQSDYHVCPENGQTMASWMMKHKLAFTKENFEIAYRRLTEGGFLLSAPIAAEEHQANSQPELEQDSRITAPGPAPIKRPVKTSSGLSRSNSSTSGGAAPRTEKFTQAEIEKMTAEEYRAKVLLPELRRNKLTQR